jgi:hypothetical protein
LKSQQVLESGITVASKHLVGYNLPSDFIDEITPLVSNRLFPALNGTTVDDLMLPSIARHFSVKRDGYDVSYNNPTISKIIPTRVHIQYGPSPVPEKGYTLQQWAGFITLAITDKDAEYQDYHRQKVIEQSALDAGIFLRIDTRVLFKTPLEFSITDTKRGLVCLYFIIK